MAEALSKFQQPPFTEPYSPQNSCNEEMLNDIRLSTRSSQGGQPDSDIFSIEWEYFLEQICDFCERIQAKAVKNVKQTSQVLRKFKVIKQFKDQIDKQWKNIQSSMRKFIKTDEQIIKQYTQIRVQALKLQQYTQSCQNLQQLKNLSKLLQNSEYIRIQSNKIKISPTEQDKLEQKIDQWYKIKKQITRCQEMVKQYSIKIVETAMDQNEADDDLKTSKKASTKEYFCLRQEVQALLNATCQNQDSIIQSSQDLQVSLQQIQVQVKEIRKAATLVQHIYDLFQNLQL